MKDSTPFPAISNPSLQHAATHNEYNTYCANIILFIAKTINNDDISAIYHGHRAVLCNISKYYDNICIKSNTYIIYQSTAMACKALPKRITYVILNVDNSHRSKRKAYGNDCDERTNLYSGSSGRSTASITRYDHATYPNEEAKSFQSRKLVENNGERNNRVLRSAKQYGPRQLRQTEGQINKASVCWHTTTKNSVASGQMVQAWKTSTKALWNSLPFFSIANIVNNVKTLLYKAVLRNMGMR